MRQSRKRELQQKMREAGVRNFKYTGTMRAGIRIKPNEKCPCGSEEKYKHCCKTVADENRRRKESEK